MKRRLPIRADYLSATNTNALDLTFADTGLRPSGKALGTNYLTCFPPTTRQSELLDDGTDSFHAPDTSFKYRLWTGGSFGVSPNLKGRTLRHGDLGARRAVLFETISEVRVRGDKFFVAIDRVPCLGVAEDFGDPVTSKHVEFNSQAWLDASHSLTTAFFQLDQAGRPQQKGLRDLAVHNKGRFPALYEKRWICFMREKPELNTKPEPTPLPEDVFLRHSLTTTPAMLFRFSALTFNAHAIHIDPQYTQQVYGLPDLLVHGPMTLHMLHCHAMQVADNYNALRRSKLHFDKITYQNIAPIFVRDTIEIGCTTPMLIEKPFRHFQAEMWIAKRVGTGSEAGMAKCVKADVYFHFEATAATRDASQVVARDNVDESVVIDTPVPDSDDYNWTQREGSGINIRKVEKGPKITIRKV
jgi:hydroxyacyl-ACP dehydratase HTD2-like protein with hotdog domain